MKDGRYEMRMYCIVMYNISTMQKGVQAAHCCLEYANKYRNDSDLIKYVEEDKTMIILDGGSSSDLVELDKVLKENEIKYASFIEPDLNNAISCVCFLADERVWNRREYPNREEFVEKYRLETFDTWFINDSFLEEWSDEADKEYLEMIGGEKNEMLRNIIQYKKLSA